MHAASILRNPWIWGLVALFGVAAFVLWRWSTYAKQRMTDGFKYFSYGEFDSADEPGSGKLYMSKDLIQRLGRIREAVGFPMMVSSGYRSKAHNAKVGGVPNSAHRSGLAVDIRAVTDAQKRAIAKAAIANGITRIGWGRTFIHLDIDGTKPQHVAWGYPGSAAPKYSSLA